MIIVVRKFLVGFTSLLFSQVAAATLLTFDEPAVAFQDGYGPGDLYVESGYSLQTTSDPGRHGSFIRFNPFEQRTLVPNNGTTHVGITFYANPWLERVDSLSFSLLSLDIAEYNSSFSRRRGFSLTGITASGDILNQVLRLDGIIDGFGGLPDFQRVELSWSNLVRLEFDSDAVAFDNVEVEYVSEPSVIVLFGIAIISIGLSRRGSLT